MLLVYNFNIFHSQLLYAIPVLSSTITGDQTSFLFYVRYIYDKRVQLSTINHEIGTACILITQRLCFKLLISDKLCEKNNYNTQNQIETDCSVTNMDYSVSM